jgi:hypothetical protein
MTSAGVRFCKYGLLVLGNLLAVLFLTASIMAALGARKLDFFPVPWNYEANSCDLHYQWNNFHSLLDGRNPYRIWLEHEGPLPTRPESEDAIFTPTYLPSSLALFSPLLLFPWPIARLALILVNLGCLYYLSLQVGRCLGPTGFVKPVFWGAPLLLILPNTWFCFAQGQLSLITVAAGVGLGSLAVQTKPPSPTKLVLLALLTTIKPSLFLTFCGAVFALIGWRSALAVCGFHALINLAYSLFVYRSPLGLFVDWYRVCSHWLEGGSLNLLGHARPLAQQSAANPLLDRFLSVLPMLLLFITGVVSYLVVRRRKDLFLLVAGISATAGFLYTYTNVYDFVLVIFLFLWFLPLCRRPAAPGSPAAILFIGLGYYYGWYNTILTPNPFNRGAGYTLSMSGFILWLAAMIWYQRHWGHLRRLVLGPIAQP